MCLVFVIFWVVKIGFVGVVFLVEAERPGPVRVFVLCVFYFSRYYVVFIFGEAGRPRPLWAGVFRSSY